MSLQELRNETESFVLREIIYLIFVSSDKPDKGSIKFTVNLKLISYDFFPLQ